MAAPPFRLPESPQVERNEADVFPDKQRSQMTVSVNVFPRTMDQYDRTAEATGQPGTAPEPDAVPHREKFFADR